MTSVKRISAFRSAPAPGSLWARSRWTPPRSLEDFPCDIRTTDQTTPRSSKETPLPGTVTHPGSLTTGSQEKKELGHTSISGSQRNLTAKNSDTPRISGSQETTIKGSQRKLDSEESWINWDYRKDRLQSDILRTASTWDNQMAGGRVKNKATETKVTLHHQNQTLPP